MHEARVVLQIEICKAEGHGVTVIINRNPLLS